MAVSPGFSPWSLRETFGLCPFARRLHSHHLTLLYGEPF